MIVEETPARRSSSYDFYIVLYQLARLPEERLKPIFHDAQWNVMTSMLVRAKGFQQMLSKQGLLPEDSGNERWVVSAEPEPEPEPEAAKSTRNEKKSD